MLRGSSDDMQPVVGGLDVHPLWEEREIIDAFSQNKTFPAGVTI